MSERSLFCLRRSSAICCVTGAFASVCALCECGGDVERQGGSAGQASEEGGAKSAGGKTSSGGRSTAAGGSTSTHAGADFGGAAGEFPTAGSGGEESGSGGKKGTVVVECPGGRLVAVTGPACGDGQLDVGEMCDDGNVSSGDGCSSQCRIDSGWSCPDVGESCRPCGNCEVDEGEGCDDGNQENGDGCSARCQVEEGYRCFRYSYELMGSACVDAGDCGDGELTVAGEVCDDGNQVDGDGCSADCSAVEPGYLCSGEGEPCQLTASLYPHCGDGHVQPDDGETCDDGINDGRRDGCSVNCQIPACGDGQVQPWRGEECDDGVNIGMYLGCRSDCTMAPLSGGLNCSTFTAFCGDGLLQSEEGETCDDGINDGLDGRCNSDCTPSREGFCGDGVVDVSYEECDDGNVESCDGCTAMCQRESQVARP